jgi:methanogenic corrinoid protein MtbC1
MERQIDEFTNALLSLDRVAVQKIISATTSNTSPLSFVEKVVVVALDRIGKGWQEGTVSLAQIYMSGRICEQLVDEILPPAAPERKDQPKMAICTLVDHHMLGKAIVYSLLRASGFELADYGSLSVQELVARVKEDGIKVLLISVLMLPSALQIKTVKELLGNSGCDVKIIVGGAPFRFDRNLWREIGADAMCENASEAVTVIGKIMEGIHG